MLLDVDEVIVPRFVEMIVPSIYLLSISLLIYLSIYPSIYLSVYLSTHLSIYLLIYLFILIIMILLREEESWGKMMEKASSPAFHKHCIIIFRSCHSFMHKSFSVGFTQTLIAPSYCDHMISSSRLKWTPRSSPTGNSPTSTSSTT